MATTISQGFARLKSNLEITDPQTETVSGRQNAVRKAVEDEMTVLDSFLTGSYSRSTLIAPLSQADVDIFVVLDSSYFERNGQASLVDKVKRVLKKTYPNTPDISRNGQAVTITFSDFVVDVVPGFCRNGGGFLIPNSQGGTWIETDPKKHVSISSQKNSAHDQMLVPLIKMLKCIINPENYSSSGNTTNSLNPAHLSRIRGTNPLYHPGQRVWFLKSSRVQ
jgi:Second Messenger Oligonucleotide or Dinucleotide Synthetase domain